MTERHDLVHGIKDDGVLEHSVVVELPKVLDFGDTALIELKVILLEAECDGLDHGIDDANDKVRVVPVNSAQQDREEVDVAIFDLSGLGEDLVKDGYNLRIVRPPSLYHTLA